ncbi:proline--tRNA ligase [soil metagenome]
MRMSALLFQSLREAPAEAELASHRLLLRGGFVRQVAAGLFDYLPLGLRVLQRLEALLREEMNALGAQEVSLPVVQPAELWQKTGRWDTIGADLARFQDRLGRDYCLGMTHEEVATEMVAGIVQSYRQLPVLIYQLQTKFRDEPRPRGGLLRTREFTMKDAYSFHADEASLDLTYRRVMAAYFRIFERCGLEVVAVASDTGLMGGNGAHEFMMLTPVGEDTILLCSKCDYKANRQIATFGKTDPEPEEILPTEEVATPDTPTIGALAAFLEVSEAKTAKAVFFVADLESGESAFVFALVRGDMTLNETKLSQQVRAKTLRPATPEEVRATGAEPGYASPVGLERHKFTLVVDDAVTRSPNLVAGANRPGFHLRNANYGRDYTADLVADIAAASAGDACPVCGHALTAERGLELGNIFKLGTFYSEALGALFTDPSGHKKPLLMGSYGVGVGRLMAAVVEKHAEKHHDAAVIVWPAALAPFEVALLSLADRRQPEVAAVADSLCERLKEAGFDVLYDDRNESPGVKFADADLVGAPLQVVVGRRGVERGVAEVKRSGAGEKYEVDLEHLPQHLRVLSSS